MDRLMDERAAAARGAMLATPPAAPLGRETRTAAVEDAVRMPAEPGAPQTPAGPRAAQRCVEQEPHAGEVPRAALERGAAQGRRVRPALLRLCVVVLRRWS